MGKRLVSTECKRCGGTRQHNRRSVLICVPCATATLNARRERLKMSGLCHTCGRESIVGTEHVYCKPCRVRKTAGQKRIRELRTPYACKNCGVDLPSDEFKHCAKCLAYSRAAKINARNRGMCTACKKVPATAGYASCDKCREVRIALRRSRASAGICGYGSDCSNPNAPGKLCCEWHLKRNSTRSTQRRRRDRELIIVKYGGGCACCGDTTYEFLAIDHVRGGGKGEGGNPLVKRVIREGFPDTFRMLCHNCNMARGIYGYCPHERQIELLLTGGVK